MNGKKAAAMTGFLVLMIAVLLTRSAGVDADRIAGVLTSRVQKSSAVTFVYHPVGNYDYTTSCYPADVDGDGDVDVLSTTGTNIAGVIAISWWENLGDHFSQHTVVYFGVMNDSVYATDLDQDGDTDALGQDSTYDNVFWCENDGDQSFSTHYLSGSFNAAMFVYAADVDSDGDIDVLAGGSGVAWWENDGNESFSEHTIAASFAYARSLQAPDLDADGDVDILGAATSDYIAWWENDGSEGFSQHTITDTFDGARSVHAADIDSDGDLDVLGAARGADAIAWWENDGDESFAQHTITDTFSSAIMAWAADVDGDRDFDIVGGARGHPGIVWWENDGDEGFGAHIVDADRGWNDVYPIDVDGDGDIDLVASGPGGRIAWFEQEGSPVFVFLPIVLREEPAANQRQ